MSHDKPQVSQPKTMVKNTVVLVSLRVLIPLLSVALMLVLARQLGVDGIGRYTLAYSFLMLANTVGPLGLYAIITRDGARHRDRLGEILNNSFTLGAISSIILTFLMAVSGSLLGYDAETQTALWVLSFAILPFTLSNFVEAGFVAIERTEYIAASTLVEYVFKVGIGVALLFQGYGLEVVLWLAVIGRTIALIVGWWFLRRQGLTVGWNWTHEATRLLKLTPTFLAISVVATLYWRIDILMLSALTTITEVGYYGAAWRLLDFAMVIPTSLCLALYPQIALLIEIDRERLAVLAQTALRYLFALTLPITVATTIISEELLVLLFGEAMRPAGLTLQILIWTLVPYALVRYQAYVLVGAHLQRIDLLLNATLLTVNAILNLLLIPRFGTEGAAMATLIAVSVYAGLQTLYFVRKLPDLLVRVSLSRRVIVAVVITALVLWLTLDLHVIVAMLVAPAVYLVTLLGIGFVTVEELSVLGLDRYSMLTRLCTAARR